MRRSSAPSQVAKRQRTTSSQKKSQSVKPSVPRPVNSWGRFNRQVGFPNKLLMRHRYVQGGVLTSTTGSLATYNFRANGMFDPDQSGTGHQPMYFDQLTAIYNHFTVIGSVISVEFVPASSQTLPTQVGILVNDDPTVTPTTAIACAENSTAVSRVTSGTGNVQPFTLTAKFSAKGTFGGNVLGNDNLQGTVSADPTEQTIYTLFGQTLDNVGTSSVYFRVTIEYLAVWEELKDLISS